MRKISLTDYEGTQVKARITEVLFSSSIPLTAQELLDRNSLNIKITGCIDEVLLEESEYTRLKSYFDTFKGFDYEDLELIQRVLNAPLVEVVEKKVKT